MTLLDLFDAALRDRADALALNGLTYAQLHGGARRVARRLHELGVRRGDRVSLYCENRLGYVFAYLALLRIGAIVVPTNVLYRAADLQHVVEDAAASRMLVGETTRDYAVQLPSCPPAFDAADVERWALDDTIQPYERDVPAQPSDVITIIYTSGTTGRSKGAMLTHDNMATVATQLATAWRWTPADTLVAALPLFHVHGLGAALNGTLCVGARLILHERFDAQRVLADLRRPDVTMFFGVPTMYVRLLENIGEDEPPKLRLAVSGSAALSAEIHRAFRERFGTEILERYGATEFGFALTNRYAGPRVGGSVGIPFPGTRVRVVPVGGTEPLLAGEVGELLVNGPTVFAGYWNLPEATAQAFAVDDEGTRWYRSGDLATYDADDDVYRIVGRLKELIITGGFNVYPREIENEIDRYPNVVASAVVGMPDAARGELPVAFVECSGDVDAEALAAYLRERLASFKVPKAIRIVDALPRNAMGKIEKGRLKNA
ncbi:MAG TPA: AMP-binding protein [Candidatus Baltobacteraceae bacterium]|nr:AMP-binding protein [Candidatus Baltobacteraceae bacterium]